ncbi:MAG: ATP-binding cassette domain-containing protein, partial [Polyangiales bacterium]
MSLAVFDKVSLSFGKKTIVDELDLRLAADDRIGLIGPNGSGKTSILRMLAGEQMPDGGRMRMRRGMRLGYLPQDIALTEDKPLLQFVVGSVEGRKALDASIAECEAELATVEAGTRSGDRSDEELMEVVERLSDLHERATHYELHYTEHEATRILAGLGFATKDLGRLLHELSGGWKMRAVLGALLFQKPDLLLLDEPTNHLDLESIRWLENFLVNDFKGTLVVVSHDRHFLNSAATHIADVDYRTITTYTGGYDDFIA